MLSSRNANIKRVLRQYSMYFALAAIMLIFSVATEGTFLTPRNLTNLIFQTSYIAVLAIGVVFILIAGHTDMSIGSMTGLIGGIMATLQVKMGMSTPAAVGIGIAVGLLAGAWQGFWVAYREVPAFMVTLAGYLFFRGALIMLTKGETIAPMQDSFKAFGQSYLPRISEGFTSFHDTTALIGLAAIAAYVLAQSVSRARQRRHGLRVSSPALFAAKLVGVSLVIGAGFFAISSYRGLPYAAVVLVVLTCILSFISTKTPFGRYVFAIGGNNEASRFSGINIKQVTFTLFVVMGGLAAVSGMLFTARLNSATASAGTGFEFDAITAAVIGGASVMGGEGSVVGAVIGALVMGSLNNGMSLLNVPTDRQQMIKGLILLLVVWFDISMRKKQKL